MRLGLRQSWDVWVVLTGNVVLLTGMHNPDQVVLHILVQTHPCTPPYSTPQQEAPWSITRHDLRVLVTDSLPTALPSLSHEQAAALWERLREGIVPLLEQGAADTLAAQLQVGGIGVEVLWLDGVEVLWDEHHWLTSDTLPTHLWAGCVHTPAGCVHVPLIGYAVSCIA